MKKIAMFLVFTIILIWGTMAWAGDVFVRGYFRKDGTYVRPHYRSAPDGNPYNNWSTKGNINPYTGRKGYKNPSLYRYKYRKYRSKKNYWWYK